MPLGGLFDFDGELVLADGNDFFGRHVFPLVATPDNGAEPLAGAFGPFDGSDGSDGGTAVPALPILGGLFETDTSGPPSTPALFDIFSLFGGRGDDQPSGGDAPSDEPFIIVGLFGGHAPAPAEFVDELGSLIICPADPAAGDGASSGLTHLFGF